MPSTIKLESMRALADFKTVCTPTAIDPSLATSITLLPSLDLEPTGRGTFAAITGFATTSSGFDPEVET